MATLKSYNQRARLLDELLVLPEYFEDKEELIDYLNEVIINNIDLEIDEEDRNDCYQQALNNFDDYIYDLQRKQEELITSVDEDTAEELKELFANNFYSNRSVL